MPKEEESFGQNVRANKSKRRRSFVFIINLLLLAGIAALGYFYYESQKEIKALKNPNIQAEAAKQEALATEAALRKIVLLPTGEAPQVFVIQDAKAAVKEQPSLAGVVDGDRVLLYVKSGKAFVYSPSRKILVGILPLTVENTPPAKQTAPVEDNSKDSEEGE